MNDVMMETVDAAIYAARGHTLYKLDNLTLCRDVSTYMSDIGAIYCI